MSEYDASHKPNKGLDMLREEGLTYDDYASLDDDLRYELVDGKLELMSPGPSVPHQLVSSELLRKIAETCGNEFIILCAPLDVILSMHEVRQPDLVIINRNRMHIVSKRAIEGPPDVVVEILSPSTRRRDKLGKMKSYSRYRIPEYWIVEPELGTLEQYVLQGESYELINLFQEDEPVTSPNIPCAAFTMNEIMEHIPEFD